MSPVNDDENVAKLKIDSIIFKKHFDRMYQTIKAHEHGPINSNNVSTLKRTCVQ